MLGYLFADYRPSFYSVYGVSRSDVTQETELAKKEVNQRIDSLELACAALWELLKSNTGLTDEELMTSIREVDLRDGKLDGRIHNEVGTCPKCHHKLLSRRSPKCSWCGADLEKAPF